ncbi:hypothetical protein D7004_19305 [Pedobacter jejuensis]|uniref:Uncharacterized protein n=1 Tax=Pedobacter jejuensis TaxID=1268550 RepID=A0A3N0BLD5_9SPHI|nr:hypothetical protein D7004_19305 [Pedobacter jejuensis]
MVKQADTPPCLGGGEYGKPVTANYSLKVRFLPLQLFQFAEYSKRLAITDNWKLLTEHLKCWVVKLADTPPCLGGGE